MRSRLARYFLIITALWLPLQAVAGMTMNLAPHAAAMQVDDVAADACPYHGHDQEQPATPQAPQHNCNDCGVCHLAGTAYVPTAALVATVLPLAQRFEAAPVLERPSHIPEPPQYPPKRA